MLPTLADLIRDGGFDCPDCRKKLAPLRAGAEDGLFCFWHEGAARRAVHRYKYEGKRYLAPALASQLAALVKERDICPDVLCAVPLSNKRRRQRGFDQAVLLAEELSAMIGIPFLPVLARIRHTRTQQGLTRRERLINVKDAFAPKKKADLQAVAGKSILLVDDVVTTGATAAECKRVLMELGAAEVRVISFTSPLMKGNEDGNEK